MCISEGKGGMKVEDYVSKEVHEEFARRIEGEEKRQNRRIEELEKVTKEITSLTLSVEKIAMSTEAMAKELNSQGQRLKELEDVPGDNWTSMKSGVINAIAAAIGGGVVAMVLNFIH